MEMVVRGALILLAVGSATLSFSLVGEKPEGTRVQGLSLATFVYALLGSGIVLWWPTPDVWSTAGKWLVLASFVFEWTLNVVMVRKPLRVQRVRDALAACALSALWLGCALFLWP